jgi:hypothetical protein
LFGCVTVTDGVAVAVRQQGRDKGGSRKETTRQQGGPRKQRQGEPKEAAGKRQRDSREDQGSSARESQRRQQERDNETAARTKVTGDYPRQHQTESRGEGKGEAGRAGPRRKGQGATIQSKICSADAMWAVFQTRASSQHLFLTMDCPANRLIV